MSTSKNEINEEVIVAQHPDYKSEIVDILRGNLAPKLKRERVLDYHENDIAAALELIEEDERKKLYTLLDTETLAKVLEYTGNLDMYISELPIRRRVLIFSYLEVTVAVEYLQEREKAERQVLLELMDEDVRREIMLLTSFDEDEIGSRMSTNYVSIRNGITVRQAMGELVAQAAENDNISTIYVVDEEDTLVGAIDLKDLIIARENTPLETITMTSYPYVYAGEQIDHCIERIKDYSEDSIPVLNTENKLCGVLTSQDITQLVDDEFGDDYAKLAGLTAEEDLQETTFKSIGKRLPWLMILLGLGLIVSSVVGMFESVVANLTTIVSFQSLILGMAGNVGTQSLAVTIRVLMDEGLSGKQKFFLIGKEARIGLVNGIILGAISFTFIGLYLMVIKGHSAEMSFAISFCIGVALAISVFLSSISGTVIPLIFKRLKIDPAVASGPLITTVNDLVAVVSYYGLAWVLLINMMKF